MPFARENISPSLTARRILLAAALAAVYTAAGKLGLRLAVVHPSATAVWPPAGIAFAALVAFGRGLWPGVFAGAFLVNVTTAGTLATSLGIAAGNTLEAFTGALLVERFASGRRFLESAPHVFRFAFLAALSTTIAATFGVTSLVLGGVARRADFGAIWGTWWLGDATGVLVVAPALVAWAVTPAPREGRLARAAETLAVLGVVVLSGMLVFGDLLAPAARGAPLEFLCIPPLVWAAFRLGPREATTAGLVLASVAVLGTVRGFGPFHARGPNASLLLLQAFLGVVALTAAAVAAASESEKAASRTKGEFLGLVSHELRTPLTALLLQVERLRRDRGSPLTARQNQIVDSIRVAVHRLSDMIESLLQYVRLERGGLVVVLSEVDPGALVAEAVEEMRLSADRKKLKLSVDVREAPPLSTDPGLLRLVVANLVGNAIKFTQEGTVEVRLVHAQGAHRISVKDTGQGIAREDQERIFQPFEQLRTADRQHPGIGLGLALVRQLTAELGGRVELDSAPGAGSTFTIVLPGRSAG
jgi:signal transduction histidine kinase